MFNSPAHHAQIVVKPYIGRATWPREPGACCRLVVKTGRVGFDAQERDKVVIFLDAKLASGLVCAPQSRRERRIVGELRIFFYEIPAHPSHKTLGINLGKRRHLVNSQIHHTECTLVSSPFIWVSQSNVDPKNSPRCENDNSPAISLIRRAS